VNHTLSSNLQKATVGTRNSAAIPKTHRLAPSDQNALTDNSPFVKERNVESRYFNRESGVQGSGFKVQSWGKKLMQNQRHMDLFHAPNVLPIN